MENKFGDFLKDRRKEKNLTQKDLAAILFVSESAVSKWEKGVARPDISLLPKLAETLGVSEHEIIIASIDWQAREEKIQSRKWRTLSAVWKWFFYISYLVALTVCFICNIAVNKTLSWFWIVLAALILAFSFTNLPGRIKRHRLIFVPLSMYASLCVLLAVCAIYTRGDWFFITAFAVLLGISTVFVPIYIAKLEIFKKIRKYNGFVTFAVCFVLLNILLVAIYLKTLASASAPKPWYFTMGLPISLAVYLALNLLLAVKFLKTNRFVKSGVVLSLIAVLLYIITPLTRVKNPNIQEELDSLNVFLADFSNWSADICIERNIHCIIFLTLTALSVVLFAVGGARIYHNRNDIKQGDKDE